MNRVEGYYDQNALDEWERLERHPTEFAVTMLALAEHLPPPPAKIADIGGGPGRYAIALAQEGYAVTLVDLSRGNLALAREKAEAAGVRLDATLHANALDLSDLASSTYDAVLLFGPLYHLLAQEEQLGAVREAMRLLRPDGPLFATFITRFAQFRWATPACSPTRILPTQTRSCPLWSPLDCRPCAWLAARELSRTTKRGSTSLRATTGSTGSSSTIAWGRSRACTARPTTYSMSAARAPRKSV
jgi:2-polyprenyl-3-methyl-5-hydroxy-6-metoxy-1,4-benzoquinol methylase